MEGLLMDSSAREQFRASSRYLIRQAQPVRVVSAEAQISSELRARLAELLGALNRIVADRVLWRALAHADRGRDARAVIELYSLGNTPWYELLVAGGYTHPPEPDPEQMAAALRANFRDALASPIPRSDRDYRDQVLFVRGRLRVHLGILTDRLELGGYESGDAGLRTVSAAATSLALDTAGALALPQIVRQTAAATETIASGGLSLVTALLSQAVDKAWRAGEEYRELRTPLPPSAAKDPVLELLALMLDNVREYRALLVQSLQDPSALLRLEGDLERNARWLRDTLTSASPFLDEWIQVEGLLSYFFSMPAGDAQADAEVRSRALTQLSGALEDAFAARAHTLAIAE